MKQFIEEGIELNNNSLFEFLQSAICMFVLAPYNLVNTISSRIIYLKRSCIAKMLLCSIVISAAVTLANACVMIYFDLFSWSLGKFPLIVMIVDTVILILLYFLFSSVDFVTYSQLEALSLAKDTKEVQSEEVEDVVISDTEIVDDSVTAGDQDVTREAENEVLSNDADTVIGSDNITSKNGIFEDEKSTGSTFFVRRIAEKEHYISLGVKLSPEERSSLDIELDKAENKSEFLSERILAVAEAAAGVEDLSNLEILDINVIPSKFRALA